MDILTLPYADILFRLTRLDWWGALDLILVVLLIYLFFTLARWSQAAPLLRFLLAGLTLLLAAGLVLPLPALSWLARGLLLALLVALPLLLQPEMRRLADETAQQEGMASLGQRLRGALFRSEGSVWLRMAGGLGRLAAAVILTLALWAFALEMRDPTVHIQVRDAPLQIEGLPADMGLVDAPPQSATLLVRTTASHAAGLSPDQFRATVNLEALPAGVGQAAIRAETTSRMAEIIAVDPPRLSVELAPLSRRTMPATVVLPDRQQLADAYQLAGEPTMQPAEVVVSGAAPLLERISRVEAELFVAGASAPVRETRPLRAVDAAGEEIVGVTIEPAEALVTVVVHRRQDTRSVGVRAIASGEPPAGYWLAEIALSPASVTLRGAPEELAALPGHVDTLPIDISAAFGELTAQVPLDLPAGVTAVDDQEQPVLAINVRIQLAVQRGDLLISRQLQGSGAMPGFSYTLAPRQIELLLSGPLPVLNEIEANPDLAQAIIELSGIAAGQSVEKIPRIVVPEGVSVQIIPPTVLVTASD